MRGLFILLIFTLITPLLYSHSFEELLVVRGRLESNGEGEFFSFFRIPVKDSKKSSTDVWSNGLETHQIRFYDKDDEELMALRIGMNPKFIEEHSKSTSFTFFVIPNNLIAKIELVINGKVEDDLCVSENKPIIEGLTQKLNYPEDNKFPDSVLLTWDSKDEDLNHQLEHSVYYSIDDGKTWMSHRFSYKEKKYSTKLHQLRGGENCRFMVAVSDGFHQSYFVAPSYEGKLLPYLVQIGSPYENRTYKEGRTVQFRGYVYDQQNMRSINQEVVFIWTSNIQGVIKQGKSRFNYRGLKIGQHKITLSVEGSDEKDDVIINIVPRK